jgi:hypothetical protein
MKADSVSGRTAQRPMRVFGFESSVLFVRFMLMFPCTLKYSHVELNICVIFLSL